MGLTALRSPGSGPWSRQRGVAVAGGVLDDGPELHSETLRRRWSSGQGRCQRDFDRAPVKYVWLLVGKLTLSPATMVNQTSSHGADVLAERQDDLRPVAGCPGRIVAGRDQCRPDAVHLVAGLEGEREWVSVAAFVVLPVA